MITCPRCKRDLPEAEFHPKTFGTCVECLVIGVRTLHETNKCLRDLLNSERKTIADWGAEVKALNELRRDMEIVAKLGRSLHQIFADEEDEE